MYRITLKYGYNDPRNNYGRYDSYREALRFFAQACAAGGALVPTELVALLAQLASKKVSLRPDPISLLRLIQKATKIAWGKAHDGPFPNPIAVTWTKTQTTLSYTAYQRYAGDDPETGVTFVLNNPGKYQPGDVSILITGRKEGVIGRYVAGATGRTYGDEAIRPLFDQGDFGPSAPADIIQAVEAMPPITED